MDGINWLKLPKATWEKIFRHLDGNSLLRATESCQLFEDIFSNSSNLLSKVKLNMLVDNRQLTPQLQVLMDSRRRYENLQIGVQEHNMKINIDNKDFKYEFPPMETIRKLFGSTVTSLELIGVRWKQIDVVELLMLFKNLNRCSLHLTYMRDTTKI